MVIFSDLDASLLGERDFAFEPALPLVREVRARGVEVVLVSTKTLEEMRFWASRLELQGLPLVVEGGASIFLPEGHPLSRLGAARADGGLVLELSDGLDGWMPGALRLRDEVGARVRFLCEMGPEEVASLTGLPLDQAVLARLRRYTMPFLSLEEGGREELFLSLLPAMGLRAERGGTFWHLKRGWVSKGGAVRRLIEGYRGLLGEVVFVGVGDSPVDLGMLELCDHRVVVRRASGGFALSLEGAVRAESPAPIGWVEGVKRVLEVIWDAGLLPKRSDNDVSLPQA